MNEIKTTDVMDYNELLLQAVAVLEHARNMISRNISGNISNAYWEIGKLLHERRLDAKHGAGVVNRLSVDLKRRYPSMGMSPRQLWNMKRFYLRFCHSGPKLLQAVAVLPWSSILTLMTNAKTRNDDRAILFYATETVRKGWNRDLLANAIRLGMHESPARMAVKDNNFGQTLPANQASYANEVLKNTYNLGFLGVTEPLLELELERRLVEKVKLFLLELGNGFTYVGNQYPVEYQGSGGIIDLLFFHRKLKCLIAVELKVGKYKLEYAGKMNYYLSILDRTERGEGENPSIGIILCAEKNHVDVELSLDGLARPIGVADYRLLIPQDELKQLVQNEMKNYKE
ncbi:MAG: PDDEXK nuclease domain-containing protein [Bacteroides sp.]|nr:PDDEXK nuclease domain-containing protein [Bacteroides sp.]